MGDMTSAGSRARPPVFKVVFEDIHLIVVDKPAGVLTQPTPEREPGTLLSQVHRYLRRKARGRRFHLRVVHRLDRDTSGLLVFSKSALAHKGLLWQFKHRKVEKKYLALVENVMPLDQGTFRSRLVRNRCDRRRGSTRRRDLGKVAITHYRVIERLRGATLLEVRIETGRTHQIRIHLAEAGFPIAGEHVYLPKGFIPKVSFRPHALHAGLLGFFHPINGQWIVFSASPPPDFVVLIEKLRCP
jgi:23S rRNA pseudouridine1911/1915/1917 synthase